MVLPTPTQLGFVLWRTVEAAVLSAALLACACVNQGDESTLSRGDSAERSRGPEAERNARLAMVKQLDAEGIRDSRVLEAMRNVPRHAFVPRAQERHAYDDTPLPIGYEQTISQPYVVAAMTELADLEPDDRVLEIGTGSGYQAAVLAELVREVYSIEIVEPLASRARETLERLGYENVFVRHGDGYLGWPDKAPFDAVLVTAAPPQVPEALKQQLAEGGRLVIPVGERSQELRVITRTRQGFKERSAFAVRFVPMTGEAQERR